MKIRVNNLLPLMVMLILAALTLWLRQAAEQPAGDSRPESKEPEAMVQDLNLVRLDASGAKQYSLSAQRMLHFGTDESTLLEGPRFEKRDEDGVVTTVTAKRGKVAANADEAFFYGDVLLSRQLPGTQPALIARTEYLHVIPSQDIARTDRHVTIEQGSSRLSGVGMVINKSNRQVSLQSQVKGSYNAAQRK